MRHFYKSHGKHCYLRSFQTKCQRCDADVLYWECTHGSKIFFEYPPYGKLIRHFCRADKRKYNQKKKFPIIVKKPMGLLVSASPSCPVCGKIFKSESNLKEHLKQLKKSDDHHKNFYNDKVMFEKEKKFNIINEDYTPKFGTMNIKERK